MKYKSKSIPASDVGILNKQKRQVVPDQSMSLAEILHRFTRGEPLSVGRDVTYHESADDLEKVKSMDLVDRYEFIEKLKQTEIDFEKQQKSKAERAKKEAVEKAKAELKAELEKEKKAPEKGPKAE